MKRINVVVAIALAGGLGIGPGTSTAAAQTAQQQPAEIPPASFNGKEFVDSQGCVFIRAGIDGDVSWVPRVTRDRKAVCGFQPSIATPVAAAPAQVAPVEAPVQTTPDAPISVAKQPTASAETTTSVEPVTITATAPTVEPAITAETAAVSIEPAPAPRRVLRAPVTVQQRAAPVRKPRMRAVVPRVPVTQVQYRSADQTTKAQDGHITSTTRIVPKHVAENRANTRNVSIPKGYRNVWNDGRLNPHRAEQTLQGRAQMLLVWTNTLPRRLINQRNGRDVTATEPLIYPYTSVAQQRAEVGEVRIIQRNGKTVKRVIRTPIYSTRSTPKVAPAKAQDGRRYVLVGTFGDAAGAQRAAHKIARMGMSARIGKHRKGGASYMSVQAGPFRDAQAMKSAMKQLRGAGFGDAVLR